MQKGVVAKLSVMMFLEFFIWGAWLPVSFSFFGTGALNFDDSQQSWLAICFPVSAIIAMFFANQFVDRNFAAEKFLAFSHLIGGLALLGFGGLSWMAFQGDVPVVPNYWLFFACMAVHCLFYVPTISVTNSIAFANIKDAQNEFGMVRLWGTIGWIAAAWPFIFILLDWSKIPPLAEAKNYVDWLGTAFATGLQGQALNQGKSWAFLTAGIASLVLAAFSLMLPHTPAKPAKEGETALAWLEAAKYLKHPYLLVLFIVTFIDATVHDGYFVFAFSYLEHVGIKPNWVAAAMSIGQIAEIGTMAFLGLVLKKLGWRTTMIIGILGHALRFGVFAFFPDPYIAVSVNVLHGVCYAFFFATLYILVDEVFPKDARTSAQGLFNFLILGMGPIASRYLWPFVKSICTPTRPATEDEIAKALAETGKTITTVPTTLDYSTALLYPAGMALIAAILLLLFFHPPKMTASDANPPAA